MTNQEISDVPLSDYSSSDWGMQTLAELPKTWSHKSAVKKSVKFFYCSLFKDDELIRAVQRTNTSLDQLPIIIIVSNYKR